MRETALFRRALQPMRKALDFLRRQPHNFSVIVARQGFYTFLTGLTSPYESIYVVALGASTVGLGLGNSIGNAANALIAAPAGWLVNRFGVKRYFLLGVGLLALGALVFAVAPTWSWIIGAMLLTNLGIRLSGTACGVTCTASLRNADRGTGMGLCNTLSSAAGLAAPMVAAALVAHLGGVTANGIRRLYVLRFLGTLLMLAMVVWLLRELPNLRDGRGSARSLSFKQDMAELFAGSPPLKRWIVVSVLGWLPRVMAGPFLLLYAHEFKGADAYTLGLMASAITAAGLLLGVPVGHLADRIGRKRTLFLLAPAGYLALAILVLGTGTVSMVMAAGLWGASQLTLVISDAMGNELVPLPQIGRWQGVLALARGLVSIPAPLLSGFLWRTLGPAVIFLLPVVLDVGVRLPLLSTIRETLDRPACECMA